MRTLPILDRRYWILLSAASIFGTNTGDFLSNQLHLGHLYGLPVLALVLALIFAVEKLGTRPSILYFWAAIIVIRTGATNIGDSFWDYGLGFKYTIPLVTALMVASALVYAARAPKYDATDAPVLQAPPIYWLCMLLAGVWGTLFGDYASFGLHLETAGASVVLSLVAGTCIAMFHRRVPLSMARYWIAVCAVRAAGTAIGDYLAEDCFSLAVSTAMTGLVFIASVYRFSKPHPAVAGR